MSNESHIERIEGAFRFKHFTVRQERCPMKVGTDGVLLGAWTEIRPTDRRLLDIGTGTGLIALMLAQRAPEAEVTGIDIDDVSQARENGDASPWGDRLHFVQTPVQAFDPVERFDRIVSNPPFFDATLPSPDAGRTTARHTVTLTFSDLCDAALRLLAPGGRLSVVLPQSEVRRFLLAAGGRLTTLRRTEVRTTPRRPVKRTLLELSRTEEADRSPITDELVIGTGEHEVYTPEYRALTGEFYLKF